MLLEWRAVAKAYDGKQALDDITLSLSDGEILGILGPSGSGKTTLLRITAGIETADRGSLSLDGREISRIPPNNRGFGLVFQDYALFPHLDVARNVGFGLRMQRWGRGRRRERVREMLQLVHLEGFERRGIHELSGGEQQRVALARSLAPAPRLLMLDEPMGALDASLRRELLEEVSEILRSVGISALYVTHDQDEALAVAGRIALLREGRLAQVGTSESLLRNPASTFVASFLKLGALLPAHPRSVAGESVLTTGIGDFPLRQGDISGTATPASQWSILVRPAAVHLSPHHGLRAAPARVVSHSLRPEGPVVRLELCPGDQHHAIDCRIEAGQGIEPLNALEGNTITVWIDPAECQPVPDFSP